MIKCSTCPRTIEDERFKTCDRCREYHRIYAQERRKDPTNAEKARIAAAKWRAKNPEQHRLAVIKWRQQEDNRERGRQGCQMWKAAHKDQVTALYKNWATENHERRLEINRVWRKQNLEKAQHFGRINNARRRGARGSHTPAELQQQFDSQEGRCFYCGELLYGAFDLEPHRDHRVPIARGGSNYISNIVWACSSCNLRKHDKTAEEFLLVLEKAG